MPSCDLLFGALWFASCFCFAWDVGLHRLTGF